MEADTTATLIEVGDWRIQSVCKDDLRHALLLSTTHDTIDLILNALNHWLPKVCTVLLAPSLAFPCRGGREANAKVNAAHHLTEQH